MWSRNGRPVDDVGRAGAVEVEGHGHVGLTRSCGSAWPAGGPMGVGDGSGRLGRLDGHVSSMEARASRKRSFSVGSADRDPQAAVETRPRRRVAHEHRCLDEPAPDVVGRARSRGRNRMKLAALDGQTLGPEIGQGGGHPARVPRQELEPHGRFIWSSKPKGDSPRGLGHGVEVVGQDHLEERVDEPTRAEQVAEACGGHGPCLRERTGHDEREVLVDQGRPPTSRRELAVGLVDDDHAGRLVRRRGATVGLRFEHTGRVVRRAEERDRRASRSSITRSTSARSSAEVVVALARDDLGAEQSRGMWLWSA